MKTNSGNCNGNNAVSPLFQLSLILASITIMSAILYHRIGLVKIGEQRPSYFHAALPETTVPVIVRTGLHVDHFETFDTRESEFTFFGTVWFEADPQKIDPEQLGKFNFESGTIQELRPVDIRYVNGKILAQYTVKATITRPMDHRLFPLDSHRLYFAVANHSIAAEKVQFISSPEDFVSDTKLGLFGWKQIGEHVESGIKRVIIDERENKRYTDYPVNLFSIDIVRDGIQFILLILLPLLFIFYLALFTLSASAQTVGITASVMVAIPGYRIVIQNIAPSVGYLILSDYLFFTFLAAAGSVFLVNIITSSSPKLTARHRRYAIVTIHTAVLATCAYLFGIW